jgi:hypothetical protein
VRSTLSSIASGPWPPPTLTARAIPRQPPPPRSRLDGALSRRLR